MKKRIALTIITLALLTVAFTQFSWAEEEWLNISIYGVTLTLPSGWVPLKEKMGFSEKEAAWYKGDVANPDQFLIMARGAEVTSFLELFMGDETEGSELIKDTKITLGGKEARSVTMKNSKRDVSLWFIVADKVFDDGEGIFLNITTQNKSYDKFLPILQKALESITFEGTK
ncbi:MAG: hypothetical protein NTX88_09900 [Candidatus Atribacteria bacterium]|nr:hypothetical protein [Candidatus Atribacteria bacterium]